MAFKDYLIRFQVMRKENSEISHRGPLSHGQDQNWDPKTARLSCDLCKPEIETF